MSLFFFFQVAMAEENCVNERKEVSRYRNCDSGAFVVRGIESSSP
jgi:hypothetical protein